MEVKDLLRAPCESALLPEQLKKFEDFAQDIVALEGTSPFSEQTLVALRQSAQKQDGSARLFYFLNDDYSIMGAWAVVMPSQDTPGLIEGAVHPRFRGEGCASFITGSIIPNVISFEDLDRYRVWVHQVLTDPNHKFASKATHLTKKYGFTPVRELHKMAIELDDDARERIHELAVSVQLPEEVLLRNFTPETDQLAWLTLNAASFAHHPEQGKLSQEDLQQRLESDWFRKEGFFIAEAPNGLAGYHWTKITETSQDGAEGEVYAVGVSPAWQGKKLGRALTLAGLDYLTRAQSVQGNKLKRIVLYVDAENTAAMNLYQSLGFTDLSVDRMYTHQKSK